MNHWAEQLESSQVLGHLRELGPAIDEALRRNDNDGEDVARIERIRTVLTFIGKRLDTADPLLLLPSNLQSVSGGLSNAVTHVRAFVNDGSKDQLTNANNAMDSALSAFAGFVFPYSTEDLQGLREAATAYRQAMAHELDLWAATTSSVREKVEALSKDATDLSERISNEKQQLQDAVETVKADAETARKGIDDAFKSLTTTLQDGVTSELGALKSRFDEAQDERGKAHGVLVAKLEQTGGDLLEEYQAKLREARGIFAEEITKATDTHTAAQSKLQTDYEQKGAGMVASMEAQLKRVQDLVGAIGDHGVTGGFKEAADKAHAEVVLWQQRTFRAMLFLIAVALLTAFHVFEHFFSYKLEWKDLASRLFLSLATGALAAYSASQAARYQRLENRNRKFELELRALGPFLEQVDPKEQEKFKLKIAEVFFGREDGLSEQAGPATPFHLAKETVDKALDLGAAAVKKLPGKSGD